MTLLVFGCVLSSLAQSNFTSKVIGVGVVVADLERSLDFYVNGIGMVKTGSFTINEDFGKRSGLTDGVAVGVTIQIKVLQPIIDRLTQMKVPFLGSTPTPLNAKAHFVFVQDPDGNFIELIGPLQ